MIRMTSVPSSVRISVIQALYKRFDDLHWEALSNPERTSAYARLVVDPDIGGKLDPYLGPGEIRLWIKDGPAKEYGRALAGIGRYAQYTSRALDGPARIVTSALGDGWSVVNGSVQEQPTRCLAVDADGNTKSVLWGTPAALKVLVWQAVQDQARQPGVSQTIVVTRRGITPIPTDEWNEIQRICDVVGVTATQVVQAIRRKANADTSVEPGQPNSSTPDRGQKNDSSVGQDPT